MEKLAQSKKHSAIPGKIVSGTEKDFFFRSKENYSSPFFNPKNNNQIKSAEQATSFDEDIKSSATLPVNNSMQKKSAEEQETVATDTKSAEDKATLTLSADSYTDNATESRKNIKFNAKVPAAESVEKYALVNWIKGHCKKKDGTYWKVSMYGKTVDFNFADFQVDSVDEDPIYWSEPASRWNFTKEGTDGFSATDSPGPALTSEKGADYNLSFKIGLYKLSDLPATTSGSLGSAKEIALKNWSYKVKVGDDGKFSH